jgi:hypothetical protein
VLLAFFFAATAFFLALSLALFLAFLEPGIGNKEQKARVA